MANYYNCLWNNNVATMFALWKTGVGTPTLTGIALMFGMGMAIDLIPTLGCYIYLLKRERISKSTGYYVTGV